MQFNNAAQTCWGILGDQLSMSSPQDKQLACLPESHRLEVSKGKCSLHLSKGGGTNDGAAVILTESNYHIPIARTQGSSTHRFSQQEPARRKTGKKLEKSFFLILKFIDCQAVQFRSHLNFPHWFLDFVVAVLHEVPMSSEQLHIPLAQNDACSQAQPFPCPIETLLVVSVDRLSIAWRLSTWPPESIYLGSSLCFCII